MNKDEMINYGAQIIAQSLDKPDVIKFNDIGLRKISQIIEDMNKGVMEALYNADYRKIEDDEIVIKKRQYEQLKKYNRDRKRLRLKWQIAEQEKRQILRDVKTIYAKDCGYNFWLTDTYFGNEYKRLCKKYGIELED